MKPLWTIALCLVPALTSVGCAHREPSSVFEEGTIELRPVTWNIDPVTAGKVTAVADSQDEVAIFGNQGASYFTEGTLVGTDTSVVSWRSAAVVPAIDLPDNWLLGIDPFGQVYRLRRNGVLDVVTAQYGLLPNSVREVVAPSSKLTALALKDKIAVCDGSAVHLYDLRARGLAGAAGRLAAFDGAEVIQIDFNKPEGTAIQRLSLSGVIAVAFDVTGELALIAATEDALYVERDGVLLKLWESPAEVRITGLASSGRGVWVAMGKQLSLLAGTRLLHGTIGLTSDTGKIVGSPSGDVWIVGGSQLVRIGERTSFGIDEERWRRGILPMFQRLCRGCHLPGGSSNIDLSTYPQWAARRDLMKQRLIEMRPTPMPPREVGTLTATELSAVQRWLQSAR